MLGYERLNKTWTPRFSNWEANKSYDKVQWTFNRPWVNGPGFLCVPHLLDRPSGSLRNGWLFCVGSFVSRSDSQNNFFQGKYLDRWFITQTQLAPERIDIELRNLGMLLSLHCSVSLRNTRNKTKQIDLISSRVFRWGVKRTIGPVKKVSKKGKESECCLRNI